MSRDKATSRIAGTIHGNPTNGFSVMVMVLQQIATQDPTGESEVRYKAPYRDGQGRQVGRRQRDPQS